MKRWVLVLLTLLLAVGCAQQTEQKQRNDTVVFVDPNAVQAGAYGDLYFTANGYSFGIYDPIDEVLSHISSTASFAEQSCAFEGEDVYYFFSGFEVMANQIDGAERVTAINLVDDTVKTPEGVFIGMTEEALCEAMHCSPDEDGLYVTEDGTAQRNITVLDGTVRAVSYLPAD